jgi:tetratricopeptide (TPR) repeat protein
MHGDLMGNGGVVTPVHYFLTQFRVMFTYIRLVFLPINQNLDYDYPIFKNIFELPVLISLLFLIIIFYWTKRLFSKYRLVSFSIFWFFLTLTIPESSFWAMGDVISEHRLYLPLAGYSMFLVSSVYYLFGKNSLKTMVIVLTMIVGCNSVLTYLRNKVWKDEFSLWSDTVQKSPHKIRPLLNRGCFCAVQGNLRQAMFDFNKAIEINPDDTNAYTDRGVIYAEQGNLTQAISDFNKAIEINPKNEKAYCNRGIAYYQQGNSPQALLDYNKAIEINPNYSEAYDNRARIYTKGQDK